MLARFGIAVPLGQAEVNYVDDVLLFAMPDQEVVGLHVSVDEVVIVQELQSLNHLVGNHQCRLDRELALAEIKSVLQAWPEQIHDHSVVVALDTEPVNSRNAS